MAKETGALGRVIALDWRELLAGALVAAAALSVLGYLFEVGDEGSHSPGWQLLAIAVLGQLHEVALTIAVLLAIALVLVAWYRSSSVPPEGVARPRHHARHYGFAAFIELLFWFVVVAGVGVVVQVVMEASWSTFQLNAWDVLESIADAAVLLALGVGGALATRRAVATWLDEHRRAIVGAPPR